MQCANTGRQARLRLNATLGVTTEDDETGEPNRSSLESHCRRETRMSHGNPETLHSHPLPRIGINRLCERSTSQGTNCPRTIPRITTITSSRQNYRTIGTEMKGKAANARQEMEHLTRRCSRRSRLHFCPLRLRSMQCVTC